MIIGHEKQWEYLFRLMSKKNLAQGYIFCGPEKIGKKTLAIELAKKIYGEDVLLRASGNFKIISPDTKEIKIGQIRELISWFSLKSPDNKIKMAVIDDAHQLNEEAQNCLLKTLEEPKGEAVIVLITAYPMMLLKTILSRLSMIKFYRLSEDKIAAGLIEEGVKKTDAVRISRLAMGKPGIAKDLISSIQSAQKREKEFALLNETLEAPLSRRVIMAKELANDQNNILEMLGLWIWEMRNRMINGGQPLKKIKIKKIIERMEYTKALIERTNTNPVLAMETLMIEM